MQTTIETNLKECLFTKIKSRKARIGVIGLGYVGLPLSLLFSRERFQVTGFDVDPSKIACLRQGGTYIGRITEQEIDAAKTSGFQATSEYSALADMDAILICVPTPLDEHREPDLSFISATLDALAPHLRAGQIVILESTTYPGTTEEIVMPRLEKKNPLGLRTCRNGSCGPAEFFVAYSPEREDPGNSAFDRRDVPKVVGGVGTDATELALALYRTVFREVVPVSGPAAAEMTKLLENIYRCVNIALVNELKLLCLRMGLDIWEIIDAASTKPFGFKAFYPGPGLGGHCIPVDPFYLSWKARQWDFHTRFIELAGEINTSMPYHVVDHIAGALSRQHKPLNGAKILVLGVAYKRDVEDLRESPAITVIELLQRVGAVVRYNDPMIPKIGHGRRYDLNLESTTLDDIGLYDCVVIVTDHSEYDYPRIVREAQLVVDTRNATRGLSAQHIVRC